LEQAPIREIVLAWGLGLVSYELWRRVLQRTDVAASRYTKLVRRASIVVGAGAAIILALLVFDFVRLEMTGGVVGLDTLWIVGSLALTVMLFFSVMVTDLYAIWAFLRGPTRGGALLAVVVGPILALVLFVAAEVVIGTVDLSLGAAAG
jgi:hypothetical protein